MKTKCDKCDKPAKVHLTEIVDGQKTEKHLCEQCAVSEGITIKASVPISQFLEDFVLQSSQTDAAASPLTCEMCGLTFNEFRQQALLGCPHDYDAFEPAMLPLLERAQEGASQHTGKAPRRAGVSEKKSNAALRLRSMLKAAIASEDYERAAALRDQIKELEKS